MKLFDTKGNRIKISKTKRPIFKKGSWDSVGKTIDGKEFVFHCSNKNNRSYFYFVYDGQWYKTYMSDDDAIGDLFDGVAELVTK